MLMKLVGIPQGLSPIVSPIVSLDDVLGLTGNDEAGKACHKEFTGCLYQLTRETISLLLIYFKESDPLICEESDPLICDPLIC